MAERTAGAPAQAASRASQAAASSKPGCAEKASSQRSGMSGFSARASRTAWRSAGASVPARARAGPSGPEGRAAARALGTTARRNSASPHPRRPRTGFLPAMNRGFIDCREKGAGEGAQLCAAGAGGLTASGGSASAVGAESAPACSPAPAISDLRLKTQCSKRARPSRAASSASCSVPTASRHSSTGPSMASQGTSPITFSCR